MTTLERTNPPDNRVELISSRAGRFAALAVICLAELLVVLDNTIVNVALPSIGVELHTGVSGLQWVVDAYTLTFAGLLLACGNLGDRYGRRRIMIIGLIGVGVMSVAGANAETLGQVIAARAAMGVFAAAVFPATLALIINIFTDTRERALAIAAWTAMAGFAIAIGPMSGGWLLEHFSWHSVFWINVPVAAVAIIATLLLVPESKAAVVGRLDLPGIVLSIAGITLLVWSIIEAPRYGWLSLATLGGIAAAAVLLGAFVWWQLRTPTPILDMRLFRIRRFSLPALAIAIAYFSMFGFLFLITQYFQGVREYTPLEFGIASLPFAVSVAVGAPIATLLAQRIGTTAVIVFGLLLTGLGLYLGGLVDVDSTYLADVLPSMVSMALGLAIVQGPATESIMSSLPLDEAGAGSAVNDTTREIGGTLGVAVLGSIVASYYSTTISPIIDRVPAMLMNEDEKGFARATVLSVLEIRKREIPTMLEPQRENLITAMKSAVLQGSQTASLVAAGAVVVCAIIVAIFLPWAPSKENAVLLAWRNDEADPQP
ncbi:EmrB/QacA subfamily drug resistance transporter [Rhodococcus sp. OK611]|jgi:EmrB/QacA subfamily drug resistance transporter|uniref:MFS transporter n=1 Tax=unclassified Rhodococcus (in: high G+C Gram-positive bacteria) TaxID=192944 RepID=UPI000BCD8C32|nr:MULTISPECIES: MFS transporter [unclassified Rhodococcus (in: high G+C Gram-positive bacteria)]PTR43963.1 EmrB/QacA subfamily drug resistance transporter [Rhodococcus sp. OK611]SNX90265.1 drug resistance transporter, EmrB/QacA subfamily [Rhodococcus sp. OK270]